MFSSPRSSQIETFVIDNTLDENEKPIASPLIDYFCQSAFNLEKNIYILDTTKFGIEEFKKAFLGTNKLKTHPPENSLPYNPEDICIFKNSLFLFKDGNKDIGYFSALCFFKKKDDKIESVHIRFLAGMEENYRGLGFYYIPIFKQVFSILHALSDKYPDQNPVVNITQFAMVSAGTPGAIVNFSNILKILLPHLKEFDYGSKDAIKMACMFGLRELIDLQTGKAAINMKIRNPTLFQNKQNQGAKNYYHLHLQDGEGITGLQELGKLKELLPLQAPLQDELNGFSQTKSRQAKL